MVDKSGWIFQADGRLIQFACIQPEALMRQQVDQCHFSPKTMILAVIWYLNPAILSVTNDSQFLS